MCSGQAPGERFSEIIILGHSEGSLIGMAAAQKSDVSKYISLAGAGKPADVIIKEQMHGQTLPQELIDESDRQKNLATYSNPDLPLKPELLHGLVDFIRAKR